MKKAFFSFYYDEDYWRVQQVRNMGKITGNQILDHNDWEAVKRKGDSAIKNWIKKQMDESEVLIVLIGENTYKRDWVLFEIKYAIETNKKIVGIYIHNLKDRNSERSKKGYNPLNYVSNGSYWNKEVYEPSYSNTYSDIENKLSRI